MDNISISEVESLDNFSISQQAEILSCAGRLMSEILRSKREAEIPEGVTSVRAWAVAVAIHSYDDWGRVPYVRNSL